MGFEVLAERAGFDCRIVACGTGCGCTHTIDPINLSLSCRKGQTDQHYTNISDPVNMCLVNMDPVNV